MAYVQKANPFKQANSGQSLYTVEQTPPIQHIDVSNNQSPTLRRKSNEPRKTTKGKGFLFIFFDKIFGVMVMGAC